MLGPIRHRLVILYSFLLAVHGGAQVSETLIRSGDICDQSSDRLGLGGRVRLGGRRATGDECGDSEYQDGNQGSAV